jgi:4-hydroxy-4-methyl-2-oxoglutarate aldolase
MSVPTYDSARLEQARRLGTSTLFEALGIASSSVDPAIHTVWPGASIAGPAYPLEC